MIEILTWLSDHLAALVAAAALVSSLFNRKKLRALHVDINSRLSELIKASGEAERAKGVAEGRELGAIEGKGRVAESERAEDRADKRAHVLLDSQGGGFERRSICDAPFQAGEKL
jgi:hypothetical protein